MTLENPTEAMKQKLHKLDIQMAILFIAILVTAIISALVGSPI